MRSFHKNINFLLFFLSVFFNAQTNLNQFTISRISQDNGLSQGSNYFRFEDQKGFMWMTGNDALNRYDGSSVKVYNLDYYFKNCPNLQQGYGFAEGGNRLFVGAVRGLYQYDYDKDEFSLIDIFTQNKKDKTAMPIGFSQNKIWCFNKNFEINSYDVKTKKIKSETAIPIKPIKSVHIYDNEGNLFYARMPFLAKNNKIWFIGKNEIATYDLTTKKTQFPLKDFGINENLEFFSSAYDAPENKIYLGLKDGILILDLKNNQSKTIKSLKKVPLSSISCLAVSKDKIIGRVKSGAFITDKNFTKSYSFTTNFERSFCFSFDKIGRFWFCDDGKGQALLNFKGNLLRNSNEFENPISQELKTLGVNNFAELPNGNILIQSKYLQNQKNNEFTELQNTEIYKGIVGARSYSDDQKKGIFFTRENPNNKHFQLGFLDQSNRFQEVINETTSELGNVQDLAVFKNFDPIISFSKGLFWCNLKEKKLHKIEELPVQNPFVINPLSQDRVAVSYLNNDMLLAKITENGKIKLLKKILPNVQSFYIQEDAKNKKYWVGSNEGVFYLDENFNILKKFDSNNGLAGTYIYGILIDDFGKVWCSHQHGLSSIDVHNFSIINYDKNDGIQDWDFNNRAFFKSSKGVLYFGGVSGFNFIKPPLKIKSFYKPEIYFDEIFINNKRFVAENGYDLIKKLDLKYDENNISIKALIKDLEFGEKLKLVYKIENQDKNWKFISKKTPLILNSLSPGTYQITFGIFDKFSQKTSGEKTITLHISKPFYLTILFLVLMGGLLFGGIISLFSYWKITKQKEHYQHELALETQRNKITADLHDDLGATLSSLQINSSIAGKMMDKDAEQAKKILRKIENQAKNISENIGDIIWSLKPGKDQFMTLSARIRNFANEILASQEIPVKINMDKDIDQEITDFTTRKNLILIFKEAMNNIAKYSKATEVKLNLTKENNHYLIEIADNGIGFNLNEIKGNGLQNMKNRTEEMHGKFEIFPHNGTTIKISIPIIRD